MYSSAVSTIFALLCDRFLRLFHPAKQALPPWNNSVSSPAPLHSLGFTKPPPHTGDLGARQHLKNSALTIPGRYIKEEQGKAGVLEAWCPRKPSGRCVTWILLVPKPCPTCLQWPWPCLRCQGEPNRQCLSNTCVVTN